MTDERIRAVEQGYDVLADRFLEWSQRVEGDPRPRFVERFMEGRSSCGERGRSCPERGSSTRT